MFRLPAFSLVAAALVMGQPAKLPNPTPLVAKVGIKDSYAMTLRTLGGKDVTKLKAGRYKIYVHDYSTLHNIRIQGPGLNKWTSVPDLASPIWLVTLRKGVYTVVCDPHPTMMKFFVKVT